MGKASGFCPAGLQRIVSGNTISPFSNQGSGRVDSERVGAIPSEIGGGDTDEKGGMDEREEKRTWYRSQREMQTTEKRIGKTTTPECPSFLGSPVCQLKENGMNTRARTGQLEHGVSTACGARG